MNYQQISGSLLATLGLYVVYKLANILYQRWTSPLNVLPGPPNSSLLFGNLEFWDTENSGVHERWTEKYGTMIKFKGVLQTTRLYTGDTKAVNHVLMNNNIYQKPAAAVFNLRQILGDGLLLVEDQKHKQQRKIMNPAFGAAHIRELTQVFVEKSVQLRDIWAVESSKEGANGHVEVLSWLSRMTLDVIGLAGFNYEFNALANEPEKNELNRAFSTIFRSGMEVSLIPALRATVPALRFLPAEKDAQMKIARTTMSRIGGQLLRNSKAEIAADEKGSAKVDKTAFKGRDLLSLLLRANMSTDLPPSQRMTDEDVLAQVPTFLVAGHETTSTGTTWALFALTQNPEAQAKLRDELFTVGSDNPSMDELNSLPYLDGVVRETLRLFPPAPATLRVAMQDDILPLNEPVKDKNGNLLDGIRVKKGQSLVIPIVGLNGAKSIWGEDASKFKPERWQNVPDAAGSIPGIWGNMLTFLGGPRACIGYRFALVEMKALLFTLIPAFEFELAVPSSDIIQKTSLFLIQRPLLKSDPKAGNQMPLILKPVNRA